MKLSRRTLLRGTGAAVSLPWLQAFGQSAKFPTRLVIVFSANGSIYNSWKPTGSESNFTLSRILKPLEPYKSKLLILDGVDCESANHGPGSNGHDLSMGHLLTGTELVPGPQGAGDFGHLVDGSAGGPSIDQHIAAQLNPDTAFRTLELGVQAQNIFMPLPSRMVYKGRFQALQADNDPSHVFNRLFSSLNVDPGGLARMKAKRQLVIDNVKGDLTSLKTKLGVDDQRTLTSHMEAIAAIEQRLKATASTLSCTKPAATTSTGGDYRATSGLQIDMLTSALACDLTRIATLQFSTAQSGATFPWLNFTEYHHELSHAGDGDASAQEKLIQINEWYASQFALLLQKMDAVKEGPNNESLLDHSVVLWVNELGKGNTHDHNNIPVVMAGGANKFFRTGRFLTFPGKVPHNNLFVSVQNAMGVPSNTFGNPAYCSGPLASLK
jgi:Protein of unknown function (DUF1552)